MGKWYFEQTVAFNVEAETREEALAIIKASDDFEKVEPLHRVGYTGLVRPYDDEGNLLEEGFSRELKTFYYLPRCIHGYRDCINDPALCEKLGYDPEDEWCKEHCIDGCRYDDESK